MPGGFKDAVAADDEIQGVLDSVKGALAGATEVGDCKALRYSTQVVAGTNYLIEVQVSAEQCLHVLIFKPLPHTGAAAEYKGHSGPHAAGAELKNPMN